LTKDEILSLKALYKKDRFVTMLLEEIEQVKKTNIQQAKTITKQNKRLKDFELKPSNYRRKRFD
jgi:hypothetical protein